MARLKGKARAKANKKKHNQSKYETAVYRKKMVSKILKYNDPFLEIVCDSAAEKEDVSRIVTDLKKVLAATENGVGLAAPQIGYNKRIIVIRPSGQGGSISALINPVVEKQSEEKHVQKEGCLSYPDFYTFVERSKNVTVSYVDGDKNKTDDFKDFEARVVLHEIDHLKGICLVGDAWKVKESNG